MLYLLGTESLCGAYYLNKIIAIACQLGLSHAANLQQGLGIDRSVAQHLSQGAVMKYYVRRHVVFSCEPLAAFAQGIPKRNVNDSNFCIIC